MQARIILLIIAITAIVGSIFYFERQRVSNGGSIAENSAIPPNNLNQNNENLEEKSRSYERAKEISSPDGFINTDAITVGELIGKKVILVDFWTYSCINCQRTTPYLNAWYEKYKDDGLEIIGVHTPEFEFEKDYVNVASAVEKFGIKFPVVLDNDYSTWQAYSNRYWPHKYLIDIDGFIVYDHVGEGGYEETEREIQKALAEKKYRMDEANGMAHDIVTPPDTEVSYAQSPEVYFGALRNELLGNGKPQTRGTQSFTEPAEITSTMLYLVGEWDIQDEYATPLEAGAKIIFKYSAKNVFVVAGSETPADARLLIDGNPVGGAYCGEDACTTGDEPSVTIQEERLYRIIEHAGPAEHTLEITVDSPGARFFTFTFG